jgi:hypothetical protein
MTRPRGEAAGVRLAPRRGTRFATDSPPEGDGFEPSVPRVAMTRAFGSATNIIELRVSAPNFSTWLNQHRMAELDSSRSTSLIF